MNSRPLSRVNILIFAHLTMAVNHPISRPQGNRNFLASLSKKGALRQAAGMPKRAGGWQESGAALFLF